ncbi:hypothetical protein [Hymenobacter sp.]|jgi:hypothetical protein|uniref:hypothetical protein n=1 Tax=Hymenobacter sp. TaxID=1898978 RepID=UPI002ED8EE8E
MDISYTGHTGGDPGVIVLLFFDPKAGIGRLLLINTSFVGNVGGVALYEIWDTLAKYQH